MDERRQMAQEEEATVGAAHLLQVRVPQRGREFIWHEHRLTADVLPLPAEVTALLRRSDPGDVYLTLRHSVVLCPVCDAVDDALDAAS